MSATNLCTMPARVELYLTRKAAAVWPNALVVRVDDEDGNKRFLLQRPGSQDLEIGHEFGEARQGLYVAIKHHKAGGKLPG